MTQRVEQKKFSELSVDDFFGYKDSFFTKTEIINDEFGITNAQNLSNEDDYFFEDDDIVTLYSLEEEFVNG